MELFFQDSLSVLIGCLLDVGIPLSLTLRLKVNLNLTLQTLVILDSTPGGVFGVDTADPA